MGGQGDGEGGIGCYRMGGHIKNGIFNELRGSNSRGGRGWGGGWGEVICRGAPHGHHGIGYGSAQVK